MVECDLAGDLGHGVEVIREDDLLQLVDDPRRGEEVAETNGCHRPSLGIGATDDERGVVAEQRDGREVGELPVGLVDTEQAAVRRREFEHPSDRCFRIDDAGRVVGRAEEHDIRSVFDDDSLHFVEIEREVVVAFAFDDRSTGDAAEMAVQRIGRFKDGGAATRTGEGQQQCLQDLVGTVGGEDLRSGKAVVRADARAELRCAALRIAVPGDLRDTRGDSVGEAFRRRLRTFVGVEPDIDVDLGRVVARHQRNGLAGRGPAHRSAPRRRRIEAA